MAEKKVYIGSMGPFLFDDTDPIDDQDGDFTGENHQGMITDAEVYASNIDQDLSTGASPEFENITINTTINTTILNAESYNIVCHEDQVVCNNDEVVTLP